jgi:uncharacterized protein (DUF885 family)
MRRLLPAAALLVVAAAPAAAQHQRGGGPAAEPVAACRTDLRHLNQLTGWQVGWEGALRALEAQPAAVRAQARAGWIGAGAGPRHDVAALRRGIAERSVAPTAVAERVLTQVQALTAQLAASPLRADPEWRRLIDAELRPAVDAYAVFLKREYLPKATDGGLAATPGGPACFARTVEWWTTLRPAPADIEATGRRLLADARRALAQAAGVGEAGLPAVLADLRRGPPRSDARRDHGRVAGRT